jgi:hypothetical protein
MRAVLKAQINKTDRNDARGIAQMIRAAAAYRPAALIAPVVRRDSDVPPWAFLQLARPIFASTGMEPPSAHDCS